MTDVVRFDPAAAVQSMIAAAPAPENLMPWDDAKMLLAAAAVIDHRKPDRLAVTEWQHALAGLTGEECLEALRRFRSKDTGSTYLVPGVLRDWVMRLRRERARESKVAQARQVIAQAERGQLMPADPADPATVDWDAEDRRAEAERHLAMARMLVASYEAEQAENRELLAQGLDPDVERAARRARDVPSGW